MRFVSQQLNSINNERAPAGFPQLFTASLPQHSYSHCPTLLRRQSSRIESKILKLGRRVGHTLFGVNESCRASESEPPPLSNLAPGAHWHGRSDPVFSVYSRSGEENPLAPPETRAHVLSRGSSSSCFRASPKRGGTSLSENYSSTFE